MIANKCGNLLWVPYDERSNYGVNRTLLCGYTDKFVDGTSAGSFDVIKVAKWNDLSRLAEIAAGLVKDQIEVPCTRLCALQNECDALQPPFVLEDYWLIGYGIFIAMLVALQIIWSKSTKDEQLKV